MAETKHMELVVGNVKVKLTGNTRMSFVTSYDFNVRIKKIASNFLEYSFTVYVREEEREELKIPKIDNIIVKIVEDKKTAKVTLPESSDFEKKPAKAAA